MTKYNTSLVLLLVCVLLFFLPIVTFSRPASPLLILAEDFDLDPPLPPSREHQNSFRPGPPPPHHQRTKRAWVRFTNPPDVTKGIVIFWETSKNVTIVAGQFTTGFVEGEEKEYTFKVYDGSEEIADLKPSEDSFDKLLKIREDGSTDVFLFTIENQLITGKNGVVGSNLVVGRPGVLLGKSHIAPLSCN